MRQAEPQASSPAKPRVKPRRADELKRVASSVFSVSHRAPTEAKPAEQAERRGEPEADKARPKTRRGRKAGAKGQSVLGMPADADALEPSAALRSDVTSVPAAPEGSTQRDEPAASRGRASSWWQRVGKDGKAKHWDWRQRLTSPNRPASKNVRGTAASAAAEASTVNGAPGDQRKGRSQRWRARTGKRSGLSGVLTEPAGHKIGRERGKLGLGFTRSWREARRRS